MNIPIDTSKFEAKNWKLFLDVKLTDEEMSAVSDLLNGEHVETAWDAEMEDFSLPGTLWCVKQVRPDAEAAHWEHEPINVYVRGLYIPAKVFEMHHAMSLRDAIDAAKKKWKEQYGHHGIRATIAEARLATYKDMRKMHKIKEETL